MKRNLRSKEELEAVRHRSPEVCVLAERLQAEVPGLEVHADGDGACVFKVYLPGRTGPYESFLWIYEPVDCSYVSWEHVPGLTDVCRRHFAHLVKNAANRNGSYVRDGAAVDEIVAAVRAFVGEATPAC